MSTLTYNLSYTFCAVTGINYSIIIFLKILDYSELTVIVSEYVLYFTLIDISLIA